MKDISLYSASNIEDDIIIKEGDDTNLLSSDTDQEVESDNSQFSDQLHSENTSYRITDNSINIENIHPALRPLPSQRARSKRSRSGTVETIWVQPKTPKKGR